MKLAYTSIGFLAGFTLKRFVNISLLVGMFALGFLAGVIASNERIGQALSILIGG